MTARTKTLEPEKYTTPKTIQEEIDLSLNTKGFYINNSFGGNDIYKYIQTSAVDYYKLFCYFLAFFIFLSVVYWTIWIVYLFILSFIIVFPFYIFCQSIKASYVQSKLTNILITKRGALVGVKIILINTPENISILEEIISKYLSTNSTNSNTLFLSLFSIFPYYIQKLYFLISRFLGQEISVIDASGKKVEALSKEIQEKCNTIGNNTKEAIFQTLERDIIELGTLIDNTHTIGIKINKNFSHLSKSLDIFDLSMFQDWMKSEIKKPFLELQKTLHSSTENNTKALEEIKNLIDTQTDETLKNPLILQQKRLEIQKTELEKYKNLIQSYIDKL